MDYGINIIMFGEEKNIFERYLTILTEAEMMPSEKSIKTPEEKTGTRKFGLTTGVTADTSTKWAMSPDEFWRGTDEVRRNTIDKAIKENRYLDLSDYVDGLSGEAKKEFDKGILNDPMLGYRVYWFDIPRIINYLVLAKKDFLKNKSAISIADKMEDAVIRYFKTEPYWRKKLGFKIFGNKEQIENLSKQEVGEWSYSMPTVAAKGGTGSRLKKTSIKPRTDIEGRGSEASLVEPRTAEKIEKRIPTVTTKLPQTEKTKKLKGSEPRSKGIKRIISKESFIRIIPF